jgi:hypothetical protein
LTARICGPIVGSQPLMNIVKATRHFERWLGQRTTLVESDIRLKHQRMAETPFAFFRATFYRWMQVWPEVCPKLAKAPQVLAVGDLHVENFGTWRDIEGRLVWGVNDFDEAAPLPYTVDLVRLATSAQLAISEGHLALKSKDACVVILDGYRQSLRQNGRPFVLEEENTWLRQIATNELRDPVHFWKKMEVLPAARGKIPASAQRAMQHLLPDRKLKYRVANRVAGLGSLGHVRLVAIAECHGARIAREAKALAPSAVDWAAGKSDSAGILYQAILSRAVRDPDPFVRLFGRWIGRRLSPQCSRIELNVLPKDRDEHRLLFAMGWETANIHLGSPAAVKAITRHLESSPPKWLSGAAKDMAKAVVQDWRIWTKPREK